MLEQHSFCKLFRTTPYYFYFNLLQLTLSVILLLTLFLSGSHSIVAIEFAIGTFLMIDMYFNHNIESFDTLLTLSSSIKLVTRLT